MLLSKAAIIDELESAVPALLRRLFPRMHACFIHVLRADLDKLDAVRCARACAERCCRGAARAAWRQPCSTCWACFKAHADAVQTAGLHVCQALVCRHRKHCSPPAAGWTGCGS